MNEGPELELLRQVRPRADGPDHTLIRRERKALMATIDQTEEHLRAPRGHRRRIRWAVPVLVLSVGATTAAGWAALGRDANDTVSFACVADDGNVTSVLPNDGTSPVDACAEEWASGAMVSNVTVAPPLAACVSSTGAVTVIEALGQESCEAAGMAPWEDLADFEAVGRAVRSARVTLHDRHKATGNACAEESDWRELMGSQLSAQRAGDWNIEADQVQADRRCYDVGEIRAGDRTLVLIGVPDNHSIGCDPRTGC